MSFSTPGWDLQPTNISIDAAGFKGKKRKGGQDAPGGADDDRKPAPALPSADVDVEALLNKFHTLENRNKPQQSQASARKQAKNDNNKSKKKNDEKPAPAPAQTSEEGAEPPSNKKQKKNNNNNNNKKERRESESNSQPEPSASAPEDAPAAAPSQPQENGKKAARQQQKQQDKKKNNNKSDKKEENDGNMSHLQSSMKTKLGGARFRWINEQLYTTSGSDALQLMQNDPSVFDEYHTGFRSQASAWPVHPLDLIINSLKKDLPSRSLVVDLGAGDARLAQDIHKSSQHKVMSYDLVSKSQWVQVAQCSQLGGVPVPGDEAAVADAVVCSLSLMGTDWVSQVQECYRLLKPNGLLKIAEVSSRFTDVSGFESLVKQLGFKLKSKDDSNTHFILFDFQKTGTAAASEIPDHEELVSQGPSLLKPCLYKKRG